MAQDLNLLSSYDYTLPEELIAQNPASPRDSTRLMLIDRAAKTIEHRVFHDIASEFHEGDLLVLNDTRVLPARLHGEKRGQHIDGARGARTEILLLRPKAEHFHWQALVKPGRRLKKGDVIDIGDGSVEIMDNDEIRTVRLVPPNGEQVETWIERVGETPLPPYIKNSTAPRESYQTVFARCNGSVAAPTASLHFTNDLLERIRARGVRFAWVTLHIGLGTFRPVQTDDIRDHVMHYETSTIPRETAAALTECKQRGGRVIASGTTVTRTLESFKIGESGTKETNLFITPGFEFKSVDALITNFHLPKSSLLMLVSAFVKDHSFVMRAYDEAVRERYRFFSFGDAMFIK